MNAKKRTLLALLALAGTAATGAAQARDVDVRWQVAIPGPVSVVIGNTAPRVYVPVPAPVLVAAPPYRGGGYPVYGPGYGDRDRDGVPNYRDRRDNRWDDRYYHRHPSRWDADGDGIPNRHDRVYNPHWDRDGDGVPNRHDRRPDRPGRW
jgi:hypothetical protein